MEKKKQYNIIDLFSGCGGLSLGFQNAGYNILAAFDNMVYVNQIIGNVLLAHLEDIKSKCK